MQNYRGAAYTIGRLQIVKRVRVRSYTYIIPTVTVHNPYSFKSSCTPSFGTVSLSPFPILSLTFFFFLLDKIPSVSVTMLSLQQTVSFLLPV